MTKQRSSPTAEEINLALGADVVDSEIRLKDGSIRNVAGNAVVPFGETFISFAGKKLKRDFSVIRGGRQILFKAGTTWEEIPSHYKAGFTKINFPADIFE